MKNKRLFYVLTVCLSIIFIIWKIHHVDSSHLESSAPDTNNEPIIPPQASKLPLATQVRSTGTVQTANDESIKTTEGDRAKSEAAINEQNLNEWKTPIEFYGMVEDGSNAVIAGADIDFECNDLSPEGTSFYKTRSDLNGAFSIKNISGKLLRVSVSKTGYYPYEPNGSFFYYAGQNQNFVPDATRPVIFYLREKGQGTNLIHYDKSFSLLRDGTPILIDLPSGTTMQSSENALKVEGWTYDDNKKEGSKYDWTCRVSVPGGGLQTNDEEFPFLAPTSDYVAEDIIDMPVTNTVQWSYLVHRHYYIQTADGKFGRIVFTMVAGGDNFCEVNLYFNPTGSRNLEPSQQ